MQMNSSKKPWESLRVALYIGSRRIAERGATLGSLTFLMCAPCVASSSKTRTRLVGRSVGRSTERTDGLCSTSRRRRRIFGLFAAAARSVYKRVEARDEPSGSLVVLRDAEDTKLRYLDTKLVSVLSLDQFCQLRRISVYHKSRFCWRKFTGILEIVIKIKLIGRIKLILRL